ncbi:MAG: response regulator [Verrucomicrobia bacterium]|jgi:two-component system response regulator HydG|nr:response regulator [Verrucomicrobiota bacterium]
MSKRILIIDDDLEFSRLLTGVFEQAGHEVLSVVDAEAGLAKVESEAVDLVVTDLRLPEQSGLDFIRSVRSVNEDLPLVMVSGFLDDDAIRDLIRHGVNGIFTKPLNIFSLLKRANQLLEKSEGKGGDGGAGATGPNVRSLFGHSQRGKAFLKQLEEAAAFRRNLLLIGPPGSPMEEISRGLNALSSATERYTSLKPGQVTAEALAERLPGEKEQTLLVFMEADSLPPEEAEVIMEFFGKHGGTESGLRTIFCLQEPVENLYDRGAVDEEFYLFLGTNELVVPPLKELPEDLLNFVKTEFSAEEELRMDAKTRQLLLDHDWPENFLELRSFVLRAASLAQSLTPGFAHFEAALRRTDLPAAFPGGESAGADLRSFLNSEKAAYEKAISLLHP